MSLAENLAKLEAGTLKTSADNFNVDGKVKAEPKNTLSEPLPPGAAKKSKKAAPASNGKVISKPEVIHKLFAHALIQNKMNATAAYKEVKPDSTQKTAEVNGHKLLSNAKVIAELTPLLEDLFIDAGIETEYVFRRWLEIASGSAADYFTFKGGLPVLDMSNMTPAQHANLKKITIKPGRNGTAYGIEVHDAHRAVDTIGKHLGLLVEKLDAEDTERIGDMLERAVKRIKATKDLDGWKSIVLDAEFSEVKQR